MKPTTAILGLLILGGGGYVAYTQLGGDTSDATLDADVYLAKKGPFKFRVTESASLYAAKSVDLRSQVEGRAAILWLETEGEWVKKGAKVAELDVSTLKDRAENQEISVSRAKASKINAEKGLEIQKNQNASDIESSRNEVLFANLELEKFLGRVEMQRRTGAPAVIGEDSTSLTSGTTKKGGTADASKSGDDDVTFGEREQQLVAAKADIEIAEEELKRASNELEWTIKLHKKDYVTDNDLEADQLKVKKAKKTLTLAKNRLYILDNYTLQKTERELVAKVKEAQAELARTKLQCEARLVQQEAELHSKTQEYDLEVAKYEKYKQQVSAGTIYAPSDGLVVYATAGDRRRREPIDLGTEVREGQAIIKLPDVTTMKIKTSIREVQVKYVQPGQDVTIKVDADTENSWFGRVARVAQVPDSNSSWFNPDSKVYTTHVEILGDTSKLRDGQAATVEIAVADLKDVIAVPVQAVQRAKYVTYVWKRSSSGPVAAEVETGMSNDRRVVITKGIDDGDEIMLSPPVGVPAPDFKKRNDEIAEQRTAAEKAVRKQAGKVSDNEGNGSMNGRRGGMNGGRSRGDRGGRGNRSRGAGGREGGNRRGGGSAMMTQFREFTAAVKERFPDENIEGFGWMRNQELMNRIKADPVIKEKFGDYLKQMEERRRNRGNRGGGEGRRGGNRFGGGEGRRGGGEGRRGGPGGRRDG